MIGVPLRFKTAVALLLLGLLTLLVGIGQKTIWAPAETVTASAPADAETAPLTIFDQKLRTLHGGTAKINIKGEGAFLLAVGRPDDVAAWVGNTAHNTVTGVSEDRKSLQIERTEGEPTAPSPAGSDLWASTENASGELNYTWTPPADGDWSLLLANDGTQPAPSAVSITLPNDTATPWAIPLMVIGGLLMLAGLLMLLATGSGDRGSSGGVGSSFARRARAKAQARASARLSLFVSAGTAVVLAGTGAVANAATTPPPTPSTAETSATPAPDKDAESPVLLDAQIRRILEQLASATDAGDAAKDAAHLAPRVAETELEIRTQNYKIRSQVGSYGARPPVRATELLTSVVTKQRDWPRSVLVATQGEGNVVPQLLLLEQASPRENYKLVGSTLLQPGTTFPVIARGGTETLAANDKAGLLYSGEEALAGLASRLTTAESEFKDKIVEGGSSPYIADMLAYQADLVAKGGDGNFAFTHNVIPESIKVFRTDDGGAVVLGQLSFGVDISPKEEGGTLGLQEDAAVLAGGKETKTGVVLSSAESVALYVPPAGSTDPIKMIAATRGLVGASFK